MEEFRRDLPDLPVLNKDFLIQAGDINLLARD
jgi:indole-3-glycerol phosphate synthase